MFADEPPQLPAHRECGTPHVWSFVLQSNLDAPRLSRPLVGRRQINFACSYRGSAAAIFALIFRLLAIMRNRPSGRASRSLWCRRQDHQAGVGRLLGWAHSYFADHDGPLWEVA